MPRKVDSQTVWLDGKFVSADDAQLSFFAHSVHYGTAVFEGIRAYETDDGPAVFRLPEHLERFRRSAQHYFIEYDWTDAQLTEATLELIRRHGFSSCYIRPLAYLGEGKMGVMPRDNDVGVGIAVWSWGTYLGEDALTKGVRAKVVEGVRKFPPICLDPSVKATGHYLNSVRATKEAHDAGYDEGIMLNLDGRIAEGPGENIFLIKDGTLLTNPGEEGILHGVTRDSVIQLAKAAGVSTEIRPLELIHLMTADEAFFTGTAAEVTPIASVNDRAIGSGSRGPVTERIQADYLAAVAGRLPGFEKWLTKA